MTNRHPPCPECGTGNPISRGRSWECRNCGRQWKKRYRKGSKPNWKERGRCPSCGEMRMIKNGPNRLVCRFCGKQTTIHKIILEPPIYSLQEVVTG